MLVNLQLGVNFERELWLAEPCALLAHHVDTVTGDTFSITCLLLKPIRRSS